ncbi:TetR/AcrR family transcriptional regulator [Erythrobacter sp. KY5]|uniref:TetR/AcrR family transcriptional regulator n=1 Tax=Erythrobacter sp. KY5 TaxID=2011159 RepID=UPI0013A7042D|nr:TetR/AcrR family transcriptional regulator [Erythrobacter sp. KY5]
MILLAAYLVFTKSGFHGATFEAIAREAGVSKVTVYRHFSGSKHDLFVSAIELQCQGFSTAIESIRALGTNLRSVLDDLATQLNSLLSDQSYLNLKRLVLSEVRSCPEAYEHFRYICLDPINHRVAQHLKTFEQCSLEHEKSIHAAASFFVSLLEGVELHLARIGQADARQLVEKRLRQSVALFLFGYSGVLEGRNQT